MGGTTFGKHSRNQTMKLTEEEKELILKQRAKKKAAEPIKKGTLRHDLFRADSYDTYIEVNVSEFELESFLTAEKMEKVAALLREQLFGGDKIAKGTKFFCYLDNGKEKWVGDSGYSGYRFYGDWAAEHLEDIKEIKGDK